MLNRSVPLVVCLSFLSAAAFGQNPQGVGYAVQFTSTASGQFEVFAENSSTFPTFSASNTGPAGPIQIIAKPDGSQFYIVGSSAVDSFDPAFKTASPINGLAGTFSGAVISPDGRFLLIESSQGGESGTVYVLNTSTNAVALTVPIGGVVKGVAVSQDSSTAWILGEAAATFINTISLTDLTQIGPAIFLRDPTSGDGLGADATSMSLSPLNLLYVTASNQVLQIDPAILATCQANALTCAPATVISVPAEQPGPLQYTVAPSTPGGPLYAYFVNATPNIGGRSLFRIQIPWSSGDGYVAYLSSEVFDSIVVAAPQRIFAHSPADSTLWDVAYDLSSVQVSALQSVMPATTVSSFTVSDELPSAQYLLAVAGGQSLGNVYLINLNNNSASGQVASSLGLGPLQFVDVPAETPAGFSTPITYNFSQTTLAPSSAAAPLIARILDLNGNPVFGVPVTFTDPSGTLTITPTKTTTNAYGYAEAKVTTGSNPGSYPVTMTATSGSNSVTATFALIVPGAGAPGQPGTPAGTNQLSIIQGNGQLYQADIVRIGNPASVLTVQLVDTNGNPLANQPVTFTVTGPLVGAVDNPNATTDVNGLAGTDFFPVFPPENTPFEATTVTASAVNAAGILIGSVVFTETVYQNNMDGTGEPTVLLQEPTGPIITGGEGAAIPDAIQAVIVSNAFGTPQYIPNIGIRIADPAVTTDNGPGTCQGMPLSDQNGTVTCNFIPVCATAISAASGTAYGLGLHGFSIDIGEYRTFQNYGVNITGGTLPTIAATGGNNQTGNAGSTLPLLLSATVTDNCGSGIGGDTVTWAVTKGSATLSTTSSQTGAGGLATTKVTLGSTPGTVTITASINSTTVATFTETVNAIVGSLTLVSGGTQPAALVGAAFSQPLVFALKDNNNNPLVGLTVNFTVASGSATLSASSATTSSQGQVSVTVTAGNTPGIVTVNATFGTFMAGAILTVNAIGPNVSTTSFVNAASFKAGLSPCSLTTVTGSGLATGVTGVVSGNTLGIGPLPYTLEGVSISVNALAAPILSVSNENGTQQVNFQTPCEISTGSPATVVVEVNSATTTVTGVPVYQALPGIFTYAGPSGVAYAAVISQSNGAYLTPSNLAQPNGTYYLVATGLGQTNPAAITNSPGTGETIAVSQVTLAIDNVGVPVTSVQYLQGEVGEYIITFTIPATANGQPFPTGTNLPITLGVLTGSGQTIYDTAQVDLPGVQ